MWTSRSLTRLDWRLFALMLPLMLISLLIISATDPAYLFEMESSFFTPKVKKQLHHFVAGLFLFFFFASSDYSKLRKWAPLLYVVVIFALLGLFFTSSIQNVQRWYKIPGLNLCLQPSEPAKLIVVIALSWLLERYPYATLKTAFLGSMMVGVPFLLILKQPDLGSALVLFPITLMLFYVGEMHRGFLKWLSTFGALFFLLILLIFTGVISYEKMRPHVTLFLKEYQYERLDPKNHHQISAQTAIGVGGWTGKKWRKSAFTGRGFLPYAHTDSVFAAFAEEFGFLGLLMLLGLLYLLLWLSFQYALQAKDYFGRLLASGITIYLAMHVVVNIGMMCGFLPITGVPLIMISYGGSAITTTMAALGILQSIHSHRFMF